MVVSGSITERVVIDAQLPTEAYFGLFRIEKSLVGLWAIFSHVIEVKIIKFS